MSEKNKLYVLIGVIGLLLVVVLFILQPWNSTSVPTTPGVGVPPTDAANPNAGPGVAPMPAAGGGAPSMGPEPGAPGGEMMPMGTNPTDMMAGMGGSTGMTPTTPSGSAPAKPASETRPKERYRVDPMSPFEGAPLPPSLRPVFTATRPRWTGQGLENIPRIRLADFNPPPRIPGERPEGIPSGEVSDLVEAGDKRLAGFMKTNNNMMWVIMEVVDETGAIKYFILRPGETLTGTNYQVVRLEEFDDKTTNDERAIRVILKDTSTQGLRAVVLRPSPQPQQAGGAGAPGGMEMPGMGMPGMPGMPGMGGASGMPGPGMPGLPGRGGGAGAYGG